MSLGECVLLLIPLRNVGIKIALGFFGGSILGLFFTFRPKVWEFFMRILITAYAIALLMGGSLIGLYRFFSDMTNGIFILTSLSVILVFFILIFYQQYYEKSIQELLEVELHFFDGKIKKLHGFLDTGNGLVEPISKEPVSVISLEDLGEYKNSLRITDFRLIPFCSVGKENGLMEGFFLKKLVVYQREKEFIREHAMIGITKDRVSSKDHYEIILHPQVLKGGERV